MPRFRSEFRSLRLASDDVLLAFKVLKKFAEILKTSTRSSEICGRMGGEGFLMVLTHAEKPNVEIAIGRIRKRFEAHRFKFGEASFVVTASFGISGFGGGKTPDFNLLLNHADAALYSAKNNGRNRIEFSSC
jgi:diguanylate cyclase (GGDEF)-like protein